MSFRSVVGKTILATSSMTEKETLAQLGVCGVRDKCAHLVGVGLRALSASTTTSTDVSAVGGGLVVSHWLSVASRHSSELAAVSDLMSRPSRKVGVGRRGGVIGIVRVRRCAQK